jgi:type I restriction enzyme, S subunit
MSQAEWQYVRLGDYCTKIGSGSTPRGGEQVYQSEGTALIRSQNVYNGRFTRDGLAFLGEPEAEHLDGVTVEQSDILLNITGDSVARCCQVPESVLPARVNQHVAIVRPNPCEFDPSFLKYFFISPWMQSTMLSLAGSGGTRKALTKEMIQNFQVPKPSLTIQQGIAGVLLSYDELIENNRRRMALLEEAARLLYEEWFVHLRFPGHEQTLMIHGLPDGWRKMKLENITTKIGSGATPRGGGASYLDDGITLIRSLNVYDDRFDDKGLAFISDEQAAALEGVTVQSRDILLNITGASVARCCMAPDRYLPARVNQHVMIIRVDSSKADPFLVHSAINSDERKRQLVSYAQKGATREALTKEMISEFEVIVPTDALMRQFAEFARTCFLQRENLALQNQKLRAARDLLLPRLMSGDLVL